MCLKDAKCVVCGVRYPAFSQCGSDCPFKDVLPLSPSLVANSAIIAESRVRQMLEHLDGIWNQGQCLERLSMTFCLSRSRLSHLFKRHSGFSLREYLTLRRIYVASKLLLTTWHHSAEICYFVGYDTLAGFDHAFKTKMKVSPTTFRMRCQVHPKHRSP